MSKPSKFLSWLYWKNHRQEYQELKKLPWPTTHDYYTKTVITETPSNICPICGGMEELCYLSPYGEKQDDHGNELYCVCSSLTFQDLHVREMKNRINGRTQYRSLDNFRIQGATKPDQERMRKNLEIAKHWTHDPSFWLLLYGDNGTGKTHILWSLYNTVEPMAIYISSGTAEQQLHKSRRNDSVYEFINALSNVPYLFLDDWGMETGGNFFSGALNTIIDNRWIDAKEKITIVATNLQPNNMQEENKRVFSRIMDVSNSVALNFYGFGDMRRNRSQANA